MNCNKPCSFKKCPKVPKHGCACCPFRKVVIPEVLGDDSEGSDYAPENGAYQNALVEYKANGAMYIYSSDGIYTKVSMVAGGAGTATVQYVDGKVAGEASARVAGDAATLAAAKEYTDEHAGEGGVSQQYVDQHDTETLNSAKAYADAQDVTTLTTAQGNADAAIAAAIDEATGSLEGEISSAVSTAIGGLATVATTGSYSDLSNKPTVPVVTMTTTDPGEGATLAANHFIGVYQ